MKISGESPVPYCNPESHSEKSSENMIIHLNKFKQININDIKFDEDSSNPTQFKHILQQKPKNDFIFQVEEEKSSEMEEIDNEEKKEGSGAKDQKKKSFLGQKLEVENEEDELDSLFDENSSAFNSETNIIKYNAEILKLQKKGSSGFFKRKAKKLSNCLSNFQLRLFITKKPFDENVHKEFANVIKFMMVEISKDRNIQIFL